jgi:hypothetical protein
MKKSLHLFLAPEDEAPLSNALRVAVPDVLFVDDCRWASPTPPCVPGIDSARHRLVFLWSPAIVPALPVVRHPDGVHYIGPQSGVVIQLLRSRLDPPFLRCGTISVGLDSASDTHAQSMAAFIRTVWRTLDTVSSSRLVCVSPRTLEILNPKPQQFRVGHHASQWCRSSTERFLRDNTAINFYRPSEEIAV